MGPIRKLFCRSLASDPKVAFTNTFRATAVLQARSLAMNGVTRILSL
jgi:hypothetical protein